MTEKLLSEHYLNLCGLVCPINFVKCCMTLENLSINQVLKVDLDVGEAEKSVVEGLKEKGYKVIISHRDSTKVTLIISSE